MMFAMSPLHLQAGDNTGAMHQFRRARLRAWLNQQWARLLGRSRALAELSAIMRETCVSQRHHAGIQAVLIDQIGGTEGRSDDFDRDFNPLNDRARERWTAVFNLWQRGLTLPPVDLIHVNEMYFVRDGHHRVSVARALGQKYIEAVVTEWK